METSERERERARERERERERETEREPERDIINLLRASLGNIFLTGTRNG